MSGAGKAYAHGNSAEATFHDLAAEKGWTVHRSGWPDFVIQTEGQMHLVEVKSANDTLSDSQVEMFDALARAGIPVMVWWELTPGRLIPWQRFVRITRRIHESARVQRGRGTYRRR